MSEIQTNKYSFSYLDTYDEGNAPQYSLRKEIAESCLISDAAPVHVPIREFAMFLSNIYGWDVSNKIAIKNYKGEYIPLGDI